MATKKPPFPVKSGKKAPAPKGKMPPGKMPC